MNNNVIIGSPVSPSTIIESKEIDATKVVISFNSMNIKTFYATKITGKKELSLTLLDGSQIQVNPEFVVTKQKVSIVKLKTNATAWNNYYEKVTNKTFYIEEFIMIPHGDTYSIYKGKGIADDYKKHIVESRSWYE